MEDEPKRVAEAALFMSTDPIDVNTLSQTLGIESKASVKSMMDELAEEFNSKGTALEIIKVGDDRYRMQVRNAVLPKVAHFAISTDLSKPVLRTLAIIAFKQPLRQSIVVKLRGNKAYDHIGVLEEQGFIKRTKESNTFLLETTKKFEQYFGPPIKATGTEIKLVPKNRQTVLQEALSEGAREAEQGPENSPGTKPFPEAEALQEPEAAPPQGPEEAQEPENPYKEEDPQE